MKIGILTFCNAQNWGAVLQAYALQDFIINNGYNCKNVSYGKGVDKKLFSVIRSKNDFTSNISALISYIPKKRRFKRFDKFRENYLILSKLYKTPKELDILNDEFDCFITGSDQVWNCTNGVNEAFYLSFSNKPNKISYAASFGISEIPEKFVAKVKEGINSINYLSVRENSAAKIVKDLTGRDALVVTDPVYLKTKYEWEKISAGRMEKEKYIFVYPTEVTPLLKETIKKIKEKTNYKVITPHYIEGCTVKRDIGPLEFLSYINHAEYVIASSFHATAFSIIFEKQLFVIPHTSTGSRVIDMLSNFGMEDRIISGDIEKLLDIKINYNEVNNKIKNYIDLSKEFLLSSLLKIKGEA